MLLESIVAVTLLVGDLDRTQQAYERTLEYRTVADGTLDAAHAEAWGAPALEGRPYRLMQAASGEPVYLRFVAAEGPPAPALRHLGWNATELLVEDPHALERRLGGSPFTVIGRPEPLSMNPNVVAMQALGPDGELLYFTRIPAGQSKFGLGSATSFVDRVFIVVVGTRDLPATLEFYQHNFAAPVSEPAPATIEILRRAWQLPEGHQFPFAVVRLPARFLVEVDGYPSEATAKPQAPGTLPMGMAMVSFTVPSLEPFRERLLAEPRVLEGAPYAGRRVGVLAGPSGERIELIERGP
jgi:catechol 2,3-dioxygenase-like lactoylglutathione lyase family enzyme